jgi:hypothetical protein
MFVHVSRPEGLPFGPRHYAKGSVVAVDDGTAEHFLKAKVAQPHPGPAFEPDSDSEPEPETTPAGNGTKLTRKVRAVETADLKAEVEQAAAKG